MMTLVITAAKLAQLIREREQDNSEDGCDTFLRGPDEKGNYFAYFAMDHYDLTIPIRIEG